MALPETVRGRLGIKGEMRYEHARLDSVFYANDTSTSPLQLVATTLLR
jgi:hypothetical protein